MTEQGYQLERPLTERALRLLWNWLLIRISFNAIRVNLTEAPVSVRKGWCCIRSETSLIETSVLVGLKLPLEPNIYARSSEFLSLLLLFYQIPPFSFAGGWQNGGEDGMPALEMTISSTGLNRRLSLAVLIFFIDNNTLGSFLATEGLANRGLVDI